MNPKSDFSLAMGNLSVVKRKLISLPFISMVHEMFFSSILISYGDELAAKSVRDFSLPLVGYELATTVKSRRDFCISSPKISFYSQF